MARSKLQARVAEILAIRIGQFAIKENYRPEWLTSERGERLELDFYINDLRIAFEVQGLQHYQYTPHFHGTPEGFEAQLLRDESKRNLCWFHNIRLYEVADESDLQKVLDQVDRLLLTRYYSESLKKSRHGWHITKEREKYIENKMRPVSERIRKFKKVIAKASARLAEALESGADADRCEHLQRRLAGHVTQYKAMSLRLLKGRNSCALYWDTEIFPKYHGRKPIAEKG